MSLFLKYSVSLALLAGQVVSQRFVNPPHPIPGQEDTTTLFVSGPSGFDSPRTTRSTTLPTTGGTLTSSLSPMQMDSNPLLLRRSTHRETRAIDLAWPNGTIGSWMVFAGGTVITVDGDRTSGNLSKTGCSFEGAADLSEYTVYIDAPEKGIARSFRVSSEAAAHYTCGPKEEGQTMSLAPGGGWINATPDGYGEANFEIHGGESKNFGNRPFSHSYAASYWGHGRLGDYAVVWADTLISSGDNHVSAYVARDGEIVTARCGGIRVKPYGANSTYLPTTSSGAQTGFNLDISNPEGHLKLQAETTYVTIDFEVYRRFTGTFTGTLDGERLPDGTSLWEQFMLQE
ncbi:hypothetical protein BDW69DRAFT_189386 [Aspergillus filifer]